MAIRSKRRAITWIAVLGGVIAVGIFVSMGWIKREHEGSRLIAVCKQLQIGMSKAEVLQIMQAPASQVPFEKDGRKKEKLIFASRAAASVPPHCIIDQGTQQVEEIVCDDNYRRVLPDS